MRKAAKKVFVLILGIIFLFLGMAGLVLPVLQGVLFIIIGLLLLSLCLPKIREHIRKHATKNQHLSRALDKAEGWLAKFIGEV
jgi:uncharacterized membrane protein YbaN (DUF454 family)